jgi:hypothetical protein
MSIAKKLVFPAIIGIMGAGAGYGIGRIHGEGAVAQEWMKSQVKDARKLSAMFHCDSPRDTGADGGCAELEAMKTPLQYRMQR